MSSKLTREDLSRIERLRAAFLNAELEFGAPTPTPWRDARDVELYDLTLGARIAWKWAAVLDELRARGFEPPEGPLVDFGCGSGVASRAVLLNFPEWRPTRLCLVDSSGPARNFAADRARSEPDAPPVLESAKLESEPGLLVISHVLNELDEAALDALLTIAERARAVIWVEAGSRRTSRALSEVRERLLPAFNVVGPCPHREACGVLAEGNGEEWCHHFARPPVEAFQDARWSQLSHELHIDLRALPYSYLCLEGEPRATPAPAHTLEGATRVLGRPKIEKGRLALHACDESGVRLLTLFQRNDKPLFRALGDVTRAPQLYRFELEGERILSGERLPTASERS